MFRRPLVVAASALALVIGSAAGAAADETTAKAPDAARCLFEEFAVPKREMMRKVLEREGADGRMREADAETTAVVIPWMILGVALGLHAFRGIDPSEISYERIGRVVGDVILKGVGGVGAELSP